MLFVRFYLSFSISLAFFPDQVGWSRRVCAPRHGSLTTTIGNFRTQEEEKEEGNFGWVLLSFPLSVFFHQLLGENIFATLHNFWQLGEEIALGNCVFGPTNFIYLFMFLIKGISLLQTQLHIKIFQLLSNVYIVYTIQTHFASPVNGCGTMSNTSTFFYQTLFSIVGDC